MSETHQADPLRLAQCPGCGYSLAGLAADGACPECGRAYSRDIVVLFGWGCGSHSTLRTAPTRVTVRLVILFAAFMLIPLLLALRFRGPVPLLLLIAFFIVAIAGSLWRRTKSATPGTIQVHLSDAGCAQLDHSHDAAGDPMTPWSQISKVRLRALPGGRWRLRARPTGPWWQPQLDPVDAELLLTRAQADALLGRIETWRRAFGGDTKAIPA